MQQAHLGVFPIDSSNNIADINQNIKSCTTHVFISEKHKEASIIIYFYFQSGFVFASL